MFIRFSRGPVRRDYVKSSTHHNEPVKLFLKAVFLGKALLMEYGENIVGIAMLHEETDTCCDYDVVVAKNSLLAPEKIARSIKDMIGKSNKFLLNPSTKRRKYYVEEVDCESLPINARLVFTKK